MTIRDSLHALVDSLPDAMIEPAVRTLTELRDDPWAWALRYAPADDEAYTDEDRAASDRAWARYQRGDFVTTDGVDRLLRT